MAIGRILTRDGGPTMASKAPNRRLAEQGGSK